MAKKWKYLLEIYIEPKIGKSKRNVVRGMHLATGDKQIISILYNKKIYLYANYI